MQQHVLLARTHTFPQRDVAKYMGLARTVYIYIYISPYKAVCLVILLQKIPFTHRIFYGSGQP
jgi:hypothetical protein